MKTSFLLTILVGASSCELNAKDSSGGPVKECTSAGQRCVLSAGKLGVCQVDNHNNLGCMSQH